MSVVMVVFMCVLIGAGLPGDIPLLQHAVLGVGLLGIVLVS
jgi:hypothetical protein